MGRHVEVYKGTFEKEYLKRLLDGVGEIDRIVVDEGFYLLYIYRVGFSGFRFFSF